MTRNSLFEETESTKTTYKEAVKEDNTPVERYIIKAGVNRYGRQQYVAFYSGNDNFNLSAIPSVGSKKKVDKIFKKASEKYTEKNIYSFGTINEFELEIVKAPDSFDMPTID